MEAVCYRQSPYKGQTLVAGPLESHASQCLGIETYTGSITSHCGVTQLDYLYGE